MTTAEKLDSEAGIQGFRDRIIKINEIVKKHNDKTDGLIKEREEAHARYIATLKTKEMLKKRIEEVRNQIVQVSRDDIKERIDIQKDIYAETNKMLKTAEQKKLKLESQVDEAENKTRDCASRMTSLYLEMEYINIDSGRKTREHKDVSESVAGKEKYCSELKELVNGYESRIHVAKSKIAEYEMKIEQTEKDIENVMFKSSDMESNFRELLLAANTDISYFDF